MSISLPLAATKPSSNSGDASRAGAPLAASPLVAIEDEAAPRLFVEQPLVEPLSRGAVFIQYRTENIRVVPVFGDGALDVSPRVGHVHITVDNLPWHFVDAAQQTIVIVGLPSGPHTILVELADAIHRIIDREEVCFDVPRCSGAS